MIALMFDYFVINEMPMDIDQFNLSLTKLAGITVIFIGVGIPIGQLIYQVYFFTLWIYRSLSFRLGLFFGLKLKKKSKIRRDAYFKIEHRWNIALSELNNKDRMDYLSNRYGHLLNKVHELGALLISLCIVLFVQVKLNDVYSNNIIKDSIGIILILAGFSLINFMYFEANLSYFRDEFLKRIEGEKGSARGN